MREWECLDVRTKIRSALFEMSDEHGGVREATWQNPSGFVLFKLKKKKSEKGICHQKMERSSAILALIATL